MNSLHSETENYNFWNLLMVDEPSVQNKCWNHLNDVSLWSSFVFAALCVDSPVYELIYNTF